MNKLSQLLQTIRDMHNSSHPSKLTAAIENKDNTTALRLIWKETLATRLYCVGFHLRTGESLLEASGNGVTSPLARAARDGNMEVLCALLQAGAMVDSKNHLVGWPLPGGWTPLHYALSYGQDAAAIALIDAGADVNVRTRDHFYGHGYFPLHTALRNNVGLPVIRRLVENGAQIIVDELAYDNILCAAASYISDDNVATIEFLLQEGAEPNVLGWLSNSKNENGRRANALYFALEKGKEKIATALLRHKADIYMQNPDWEYDDYGNRAIYIYVLTREMIVTALRLCVANNIAVPIVRYVQPVRNALPMLNAFDNAVPIRNEINPIRSETNTHAATIHKTVSESATRLRKSSKKASFNSVDLRVIKDCLDIEANLTVIQNLIKHAAKDSSVPTHAAIKTAVIKLTQHISHSTFVDNGRDHGSKVKLSELLVLILEAIAKLPDAKSQQDAIFKLCEHMYFSQVESICDSGIFNNLVYSQQSILAEVQILIHTKTHAAGALSNKVKDFARNIYESEKPFRDNDEFATAVRKHITADACAKIMRDLFAEYYMIFRLQSSQAATTLSDKALDKLCMEFTGNAFKDIFETLDYSSLYITLISGLMQNHAKCELVVA